MQGRPVRLVLSDLRPVILGGRVSSLSLSLPSRPGLIQCYSPSTLERLGEIPVDSPAAVAAAVARGRELQRAWAATSFEQRRDVLRSIQAATLAQSDAIVRLSCIDTGKPRESGGARQTNDATWH